MYIVKRILIGAVILVGLLVTVAVTTVVMHWERAPHGDSSVSTQLFDRGYQVAAQDAETWLKNFYDSKVLPSVSVAVGIDEKLVWAGATGFADLGGNKPATTDTRYRIGSISKSLTATALMRLHERELLDIDRPLFFYAPEAAKGWPAMSLYHLATHQAGIRHYPEGVGNLAENFSRKSYPTTESALDAIRQDTLLFEPGTDYLYSTYGYTVLALAMENAAGQPFEETMQQTLLRPAGMNATSLDKADVEMAQEAVPYLTVENRNFMAPHADLSYKYAGGGYLSTPADIVRFGNQLMSGEIITRSSRDKLWQIAPLSDSSLNAEGYAMGFFVSEDALGKNLSHGGMSVGGYSYLVVYPERKIVVAIMTNATPIAGKFDRASAALALAEIFVR